MKKTLRSRIRWMAIGVVLTLVLLSMMLATVVSQASVNWN